MSKADVFLVRPFIEWWEGRRDRRDAKGAARAEKRAQDQAPTMPDETRD